jgi:hypothetical protein
MFINGILVIEGAVVAFSADAPPAAAPRRAGLAYTDAEELYVTAAAVGPTSSNVEGIAVSAAGALHVFDASAGLPAGAVLLNGIAFTSNGAMCYAPNVEFVANRGWPVDALGRICTIPPLNLPGAFTFNVPAVNPVAGTVTLSWTPSLYASRYTIFRDGAPIKLLPSSSLTSFDTPGVGTFTYEVRAGNENGVTASTPPTQDATL